MYRIMLADDEGIVLDALQFIIEKNFKDDCEIRTAKTGRKVIELAEEFVPDIAFMDIQMPGINGIEAMKEIQRRNNSTIFIVISAYDKFDYAKEAINLGVLEYMNKPIRQESVVAVLKKAMGLVDSRRKQRSQDLEIREKLENVVPVIEGGFIYSLLLSEYFEEDIKNYMQLLGIEEYGYGYMLAIVFGDELEENHMTNAVGAGVRVQNRYRELRELIKDYFQGIIGNVMGNKIVVYIPCKGDEFTYEHRIELIDQSRELVRRMRAKFDVMFRIGIGSIKPLHQALESYNEAINTLIESKGTVAHAADMAIGCGYAENYPIQFEKLLFEKVEKGDTTGAVHVARQFFDWMENNHKEHIEDIRIKCLEFVLWAEHIAYESGGMTYHFQSRTDYMPTLMEKRSTEELWNWFQDKIVNACQDVKGKKKESSLSVIDKAKAYIQTHYQKDISLDDVSREVDISPYYFSKLFKEETGQNFIEYLTQIRMDCAKQLMENKAELSMKEICLACGYQDPNYFSRIFKKNTGLTPTEYRESH